MASRETMGRIRRDLVGLYRDCESKLPPDIVLPNMSEATTGGSGDLLYLGGIILLGPDGSAPYQGGGWQIELRMPNDYPVSPPQAFFKTRIFHPNVQPDTGAVCVDTLKRDWNSQYDLTHILLVIRCLLIEPNPESALNQEAGKLLLEDYNQFVTKAKLMTMIHGLKYKAVLDKADLEVNPHLKSIQPQIAPTTASATSGPLQPLNQGDVNTTGRSSSIDSSSSKLATQSGKKMDSKRKIRTGLKRL